MEAENYQHSGSNYWVILQALYILLACGWTVDAINELDKPVDHAQVVDGLCRTHHQPAEETSIHAAREASQTSDLGLDARRCRSGGAAFDIRVELDRARHRDASLPAGREPGAG